MRAKAGETVKKNVTNKSTEWLERSFQALQEKNAFHWWKMFTKCVLDCYYTGVNTYRMYMPGMSGWLSLLTFAYAVPTAWKAFSIVYLSTSNSPFRTQFRDCLLQVAFFDSSHLPPFKYPNRHGLYYLVSIISCAMPLSLINWLKIIYICDCLPRYTDVSWGVVSYSSLFPQCLALNRSSVNIYCIIFVDSPRLPSPHHWLKWNAFKWDVTLIR